MKRLLKVLLVLFILLLLLAGGALFGVRSWVQSEKGAARIQAELGKALGVPLEIGHATLGFGGVRLVDVKIVSEGQTFLEAPAFSTEYQIMPLLHRQVVLRKMVLESPKVVWPQNSEGKWVLPTRVKGPKPETPSAPKTAPTAKEFQVALDTLEIKNGTVTLLDAKGTRFALAHDVEIKASLANTDDVSADVSATKLDLLENGPEFEKVLLPFHYGAGKLTFPKCEGTLGGGTVTGSFAMEPKAPDSPFDLQLALDKVQLARAIPNPDWKIRSGQLRAALTLHSTSKEVERGTGRGEIHLTQASVDSLEPLLRLIGESCHVPELANLNLSLHDNVSTIGQMLGVPDVVSLKEASAVFQLKKKETAVDDLLVDAGDLAVRVKGKISGEGKLDLDANLSVSPTMEKKLPTFVKTSFTTGEDGRRGIAFNITGRNDHPKTNLSQKVLGEQIPKQFTDLVSRVLKPKDEEKKKDEKKKDKDKDKDMTDDEKKAKKEKKEREKKEKEEALLKAASPDSTPIPSAPPAAEQPGTPAPTPAAPANPAPAPETN